MTTALMKPPPTTQELVAGLDSLPQAWALTPVVDKKPRRKDWQIEPAIPRAQLADQLLHARSGYTGYGLRTGAISGGLLCLDVDGDTADELLTLLVQQLGNGVDLPLTIEWTSGKPGRRSLLLQLPPAVAEKVDALGFNRSVLSEYGDYKTLRDKDGKVSEALEFRYNKCQAVLPPSQHPDTGRYDWLHAPDTVAVADCPDWVCDLVVQLAKREFDSEQAKNQKRAARAARAAHKGFSSSAASSPQDNPWDIRNFAHYLDGYTENGSGEWTTCKCPAHDGVSANSLHIHPGRGSFVCHAYRNADTACTAEKVWQAALDVACSRGYSLPLKRTEEPDWVFLNKLQEQEQLRDAQDAEADKQKRLAYRRETEGIQAALNSLTYPPAVTIHQRFLGAAATGELNIAFNLISQIEVPEQEKTLAITLALCTKALVRMPKLTPPFRLHLLARLDEFELPVLATQTAATLAFIHAVQRINLDLPDPGTLQAVSSAMSTGKTEMLKRLTKQHREKYPHGKIIVIGYRNSLLLQTARRLKFTHIHETSEIEASKVREICLCLDSIWRIDLAEIPPNSLLILDEGDALLRHGLEGGTLKDRQASILQQFDNMLQAIGRKDGMILLAEANLTDLSIRPLLERSSLALKLIVNECPGCLWNVEVGSGSPSGFVALLLDALEQGKRLVVPTDSQFFAEKLEWIVQQVFPEKIIGRLDSITVEQENMKALMETPDAVLRAMQYDLFIYTPTAESGLSIMYDGFDHIYAFFVALETRAQMQLLARVRAAVPRTVFVFEFAPGADNTDKSLRPAVLLSQWRKRARYTESILRLEADLITEHEETPSDLKVERQLKNLQSTLARQQDQESASYRWSRDAANFRARSNGARTQMRASLTQALRKDWHQVTEIRFASDGAIKLRLRQAKAAVEERKTQDWVEAKDWVDTAGLPMTDSRARQILNSNSSTYKDRIAATRYNVKNKDLPGIELSREFIHDQIVQDKGKALRANYLNYFVEHPDIAEEVNRRQYLYELNNPFVMLPRLSPLIAQVDMLLSLGFKELADGRKYSEHDELIQAIKAFGLQHAKKIKAILGLTVKEAHSATETVNKLLRKLGYDPKKTGERVGGRDDQKWVYRVVNGDCPQRSAIFAALDKKWADLLIEIEQRLVTMNSYPLGSVVRTAVKTNNAVLTTAKAEAFASATAIASMTEGVCGARKAAASEVAVGDLTKPLQAPSAVLEPAADFAPVTAVLEPSVVLPDAVRTWTPVVGVSVFIQRWAAWLVGQIVGLPTVNDPAYTVALAVGGIQKVWSLDAMQPVE